jgi:protocatechuate 3,4-dioxygenase beta subunit
VQRALQHRLFVRAAGFAERRDEQCTGGSEMIVRLQPAAFVEGAVRKTDGSPLADVEVVARVRGGYDEAAVTRSASDGSFFLGGLADKPTYVCACPEGMLPPDWQLVELEAGRGSRVEFAVSPGRTVRGVVRDAENGQPIGGAAIASGWTMEHAVHSAADGSYEFRGFEAAGDLYVRADGYADLVQKVAETDDPARCDFALVRGDVVTGCVVDAAGAKVAGAYVAAVANVSVSGSMHTFWRTGRVAADGRFTVEDLTTTGRGPRVDERVLQWHLLVRAEGFGARVLALPQRPQRPPAYDTGAIALEAQGLIEGRVVDRDGQPVARVTVELRGFADGIGKLLPAGATAPAPGYHLSERRTRTGSDGTYRFAGIGAGQYYGVQVTPDGKDWSVGSSRVEVAAGAVVTVPDIVLDPGLSIAGRVRDDTGVLPAHARLSIYATPADGSGGERHWAVVGQDRSFAIERLPAGRYHVFAFDLPPGLAGLPLRGVAAGTDGIELALVLAATIEGRVVGADGEPAAGIAVHFLTEGEMFFHEVATDADGRFRIEAAPNVTGRLTAQDLANMFRQVARPEVAAGTRDLVLKLPR